MDLSLVPITDMVDEIVKRKEAVVVAYYEYNNGKRVIQPHWAGEFHAVVALSSVLQNEILNDSIHDGDIDETEM